MKNQSLVSEISKRSLFVKKPSDEEGSKLRKKSTRLANAMALELLNYGIVVDDEIVSRIAHHRRRDARAICDDILAMYTVGDVNPPLFSEWEQRRRFTFSECVVQVMGYALQISGNDLQDPDYLTSLKSKVCFKNLKTLSIADSQTAQKRFRRLVQSKVALENASRENLVVLAKTYFALAPKHVHSDEARVALLLGMVEGGFSLQYALKRLNCRPADVLRYAAALLDFQQVKLPADVLYAALSWKQRKQSVAFLNALSFEDLCEEMGQNRRAWFRYFKHLHLFEQKDFRKRYPLVVAAALTSVATKFDSIPEGRLKRFLKKQSAFYEITEGGNLVYRTFASRVQSAVDRQDFDAFKNEVSKRPTVLFRNLGAYSHVCTKKTEGDFVELVRSLITKASVQVLFSIVQIDVDAEFRIIDSKGNTTVTEADYSPVISEIQGLAEREIRRRCGLKGQVTVSDSIKHNTVPFLSTNAELDRGTRLPFAGQHYLYFLMHWVQRSGRRTDLDHSYICFDHDWNAETIYFGNQANAFITQSGDITNAPAPAGGTEYGRIDLRKIPKKVRYIVPICNVYAGDVFSENDTAYAGFMFSEHDKFDIKRKHVRYDLSQPANSNVPFVIDVQAREVVIVDFNNRMRNGMTAHSSIGEIRKIISALKTKKFMTLERFAALISGDEKEVSLHIKKVAKGEGEIEPQALSTLIQ